MIILYFLLLSFFVVFFSLKLAGEADIIEKNSSINPALIGILIAISTSLPEFATGITSLFLGSPEMAIGNVLGSNLFNFLILTLFNLFYFKKNIFKYINDKIKIILYFLLLIYINFIVLTVIFTGSIFNRFEIVSIIIIILYAVAIKIINANESKEIVKDDFKKEATELNSSLIRFIIFSIVILISSILLARVAQDIVELTGLEAAVVGALFIGITTSLPEMVTCYALIREKNYTIAASSVLSSNLFNFTILAILDLLSTSALFVNIDTTLIDYMYLGVVFTLVFILQIKFKDKGFLNYIISLGILITYLVFFISVI